MARRLPLLGRSIDFPDPRGGDDDGLVALGGDLSPRRLLRAYATGIFPWPIDGYDLCWFSPDPRFVLEPADYHCPSRLRREIKSGRFTLTRDADFAAVIRGCADADRDGGGTWITPTLIRAYLRLHELGHAHSVECWSGGELVGGIYGVGSGAVFSAESMFRRVDEASKVALVGLIEWGFANGIALIDAQVESEHLLRYGFANVSRADYLDRLPHLVARPAPDWRGGPD